MKFHPLSELFPLMQGREFDELVADINANGLREPIWVIPGECPKPGDHKCYSHDESKCDLEAGDGVWHCRYCDHNPAPFEDLVLDGRNRWRACQQLGIEPVIEIYDGDDPVSFVISLNLHRRHLDEGQRSIVARRLATVRQGARTDLELRANLPEVSQAEAAELLNVSERTVKTAGKVLDHGAPELISAVEQGKVSVSAAADVAELPKEQQREVVARGEKEILEAAKNIRLQKAEVRRMANAMLLANAPPPPDGQFRCIVLDPPWQMEKIERDITPDQVAFEYPTMTEDQLAQFNVAGMAADDCHLFCWTTHKHLPMALRQLGNAVCWNGAHADLIAQVANILAWPVDSLVATSACFISSRKAATMSAMSVFPLNSASASMALSCSSKS